MIDDLLIGIVGGAIGDRLFGGWARRHKRITYVIGIPIALLIIGWALSDVLGL